MSSGCEERNISIDALVSDRFDVCPGLILCAAPGRRLRGRGESNKLTAADVIEHVVRNPLSIATLSPGVAAGGKEECGRHEDHRELHFDWKDVFGDCEIECVGDYTGVNVFKLREIAFHSVMRKSAFISFSLLFSLGHSVEVDAKSKIRATFPNYPGAANICGHLLLMPATAMNRVI